MDPKSICSYCGDDDCDWCEVKFQCPWCRQSKPRGEGDWRSYSTIICKKCIAEPGEFMKEVLCGQSGSVRLRTRKSSFSVNKEI